MKSVEDIELSRLTRRFSGISWQIARKKKIVTRACSVENRRICSLDIIVQMSFSCKRSVTRTSIGRFSLRLIFTYVAELIDTIASTRTTSNLTTLSILFLCKSSLRGERSLNVALSLERRT